MISGAVPSHLHSLFHFLLWVSSSLSAQGPQTRASMKPRQQNPELPWGWLPTLRCGDRPGRATCQLCSWFYHTPQLLGAESGLLTPFGISQQPLPTVDAKLCQSMCSAFWDSALESDRPWLKSQLCPLSGICTSHLPFSFSFLIWKWETKIPICEY